MCSSLSQSPWGGREGAVSRLWVKGSSWSWGASSIQTECRRGAASLGKREGRGSEGRTTGVCADRELAAWRSWPAHGEGRCILRTYCIQMLCFVGSSFPPCGPVSYRFLSPAFTRGKRLREKQRLPLGALRAQGSCPPPLCSWGGAQHSARELLSRTWVFWAPWSHLPNQLRGAGPA